jgi:hypothetical protein
MVSAGKESEVSASYLDVGVVDWRHLEAVMNEE